MVKKAVFLKPVLEKKEEVVEAPGVQEEEKKPTTIKEDIKDLKDFLENPNVMKSKPIKIIRKAKVRKRKAKKGWIGVLKIDENNNITGEKQKLRDFALRTKDGLYHATDGSEILMWEGKFPVIIQPSWKNNPIRIKKDDEKNETYGQPYIMARMLLDTIKVKAKGAGILIYLIIGAAVLFGINYFFGG